MQIGSVIGARRTARVALTSLALVGLARDGPPRDST